MFSIVFLLSSLSALATQPAKPQPHTVWVCSGSRELTQGSGTVKTCAYEVEVTCAPYGGSK